LGDKLVLAGPASLELGRSVAAKLGLETLKGDFTVFPDGESRFRVEGSVSGKSVYVIQSTYPPVDQHLFQLFVMAHHLSQEGAKVTAVVPYLGYARQDKEFLPGEAVTLGVVSHLLRAAGVRRTLTVDIHSMEGMALFSVPVYSVSAIPTLVNHVKSNVKPKDPVVIAPDFGGSKRTEAFAALYGAKFLQFEKTRDRVTGEVKIEHGSLDVKGREVIIVDDIISTGGTVKASAEAVLKEGASKAIAICVHPLMVGDAAEKLERAGVKSVIGTNTVPGRFSVVDVTDAIASHLGTLDE
jgi:ribose-phosphate pyrophosphokinase